MELSNELLEQINAYLSGQMSATEKNRFDDRLRQDTDLRQELALQRELKQGLSFLAQKDRFKHMHADLDQRGLLAETNHQTNQSLDTQPPARETKVISFPEQRSTFHYGWAGWAMAASFVLLLGIGWVLYQSQTEKRQELAQNERAFTTFFSVDLKPAPILPSDPDRVAASSETGQARQDSLRLQSAVELIQQTELKPIIRELKSLATAKPGHWSASAQWYLALAYLRNNQRTEALPLLQTITQLNGHPYQQEAQQLLKQLPASVPRPR